MLVEGVGRRPGGARPRIAAQHRAAAIAKATTAAGLRDGGRSTREIAAAMGVDAWTVLRWFHKYGLTDA